MVGVHCSVLVIDDDPAFRELAIRMLESMGLNVMNEAETFAAGVAAADELRPDAALVDVRLPDGDGFVLARRLAALPWGPRVVVTSSDPDAGATESALRAGAVGFVAKADLPDGLLRRMLVGN